MGGCGFMSFQLNKLSSDDIPLKLVVAVWCADGKMAMDNIVFEKAVQNKNLPWVLEDLHYDATENTLQFLVRDKLDVYHTIELLKSTLRYDNKAIFVTKPEIPILQFYRFAHGESVLWT